MLHSHEETILNGLLGAAADRQQILANNLTNVTTPGYVRKDLDFGTVLRDLNNTDHRDVDLDKTIQKAMYDHVNEAPSYEKEMSAMFQNQLKYLLLTRINGHIYKHMEEATQSGRAG